jgi:hypothetical protein
MREVRSSEKVNAYGVPGSLTGEFARWEEGLCMEFGLCCWDFGVRGEAHVGFKRNVVALWPCTKG